MSEQPALPTPFTDFLRANRERLNAQFAEARRIRPVFIRPSLRACSARRLRRSSARSDQIAPAQPDQMAGASTPLAPSTISRSTCSSAQELLGPRPRYPLIGQGSSGDRSFRPAMPLRLRRAPSSGRSAMRSKPLAHPGGASRASARQPRLHGPRCADSMASFVLAQVAAWPADWPITAVDTLRLAASLTSRWSSTRYRDAACLGRPRSSA